jgi:RNA polymerase sigma-70 factor, ECF subfamily
MSLSVFTQRILPMKDKLFRLAYSLVGHWQEAEDIVQEVMIKIWDKREEWHQWQNMEGYCMTITRNYCFDKLRSKKYFPGELDEAITLGTNDKNPFQRTSDREMIQHIHLSMQQLPEKQQLVMQLREIEGKSYQEIAELLDMSMEQVKINLFRARNTVKNALQKQEEVWNMKS